MNFSAWNGELQHVDILLLLGFHQLDGIKRHIQGAKSKTGGHRSKKYYKINNYIVVGKLDLGLMAGTLTIEESNINATSPRCRSCCNCASVCARSGTEAASSRK